MNSTTVTTAADALEIAGFNIADFDMNLDNLVAQAVKMVTTAGGVNLPACSPMSKVELAQWLRPEIAHQLKLHA